MTLHRDRIPLLFAPAIACIADTSMTLFGQPAAYWAGDRGAVREFNPVGRLLLEAHPVALPVVSMLGLIVLTAILLTWRNRRLAYVLAFAVTFAQGVAAGGWMIRFGPIGWAGALVLLVTLERLLAAAGSGISFTPSQTPQTSPQVRRS